MLKDNFKKYEGNNNIVPNIVYIATNLKNELIRLQLMSLTNEELRKDVWQDIKNISNCINELLGEEIVFLDEAEMEINKILF